MYVSLSIDLNSPYAEKQSTESRQIKPNLDCSYNFPIDLKPTGIQYGAKSIGKVLIISNDIKLDVIQ